MSEVVSENEILNAFNLVMPYLSVLFDDEASIALTSKDKYLKNQPCPSLMLKSDPGDPIPHQGACYEAIQTGKTVVHDVPEQVYGIPFKSYAVPVKEKNGEVAGVILVGKSLAKRKEMSDYSQTLSSSLQQITEAVNELSSSIQQLVKTNSENLAFVKKTNENAHKSTEILNMVEKVSVQAKLLGFNASIEAANAGQAGKGFTIVAQEIGTLSDTISSSIHNMEQIYNGINDAISGIDDRTEKTGNAFEEQAATLEEVAASVSALNETAKKLEKLSQKL